MVRSNRKRGLSYAPQGGMSKEMTRIADRAVLLFLLTILGSGCSFVFVEGVPDYHRGLPPQEPVDCTSARAAPMIDTMLASGAAVATIVAANQDEVTAGSASQDANVAANAVTAAVLAGSAIYGYVTISKCYDAKARRAERLRRAWGRSRSEQRPTERNTNPPGGLGGSEVTPNESPRRRVVEPEDQDEVELSPEALDRWGGTEDSEP